MSNSTPKFTRRDFQFLAEILKDTYWASADFPSSSEEDKDRYNAQYYAYVRTFARRLRVTNPAFNSRKFCEAAGLPLTECLDY